MKTKEPVSGTVHRGASDLTYSHFRAWSGEISNRANDVLEFLKYFDDAASPDEAWTRGIWDFSHHILKPELLPLLGAPFDKDALEIGYGGGRLIQASCRFFRKVIGIDIHAHKEMVGELLHRQGVENFELHQTDGLSFPLADQSVDFAYSFIVLQHLPTIAALEANLADLHRVMRPGAVGILYFGYLRRGLWRWRNFVDMSTCRPDAAREVTLRLTVSFARRLIHRAGFVVLRAGRCRKQPWRLDHGGQFYIMLERR